MITAMFLSKGGIMQDYLLMNIFKTITAYVMVVSFVLNAIQDFKHNAKQNGVEKSEKPKIAREESDFKKYFGKVEKIVVIVITAVVYFSLLCLFAEPKILLYILLIFGLSLLGLMALAYFTVFAKALYGKEHRELKPIEKAALLYIPNVVLVIFNMNITFESFFSYIEVLPTYAQDLLVSLVFIIWFAFGFFFTLVNIIIILSTIAKLVRVRNPYDYDKIWIYENKKIPLNQSFIDKECIRSIKNKLHRVAKYVLRYLYAFGYLTLFFLRGLVRPLWNSLLVVVDAIRDFFREYVFKKILDMQNTTMINIVLKTTLIGALLFYYILCRYNQLMSPQGLSVYEFIASVIIIPTIVSQIVKVQKRKRSDETNSIDVP